MDFKVVKRQEAEGTDQIIEGNQSLRQSDIPMQQEPVIKSEKRYESPKLIRRDGCYYIGYEYDLIPIEPWEAEEVYQHPEQVYDVIVSHRRKYYFNAAEDSMDYILSRPVHEPPK